MKDKILDFIDWKECEKKFINKVEVDNERIKSILKLSSKRLNFIKKVEVNEENVSFIVENYYEIIKELLVGLMLKNGLKSSNHQCLITYFYRKYPKYEFESNLVLRMSFLRNRLNYYGESIDFSFYDKHRDDFIFIIEILKNLIGE